MYRVGFITINTKENDIVDVYTKIAKHRDSTGKAGFHIEFNSCARCKELKYLKTFLSAGEICLAGTINKRFWLVFKQNYTAACVYSSFL